MYGYQVNMYNTTLDWRPLQINSWLSTATINITNTDGTTCTWLKVSTINLNQAINNTRPTYIPEKDMVITLTLTYPASSSIASQTVYVYADENLSTTSRSANITVTSAEGLTNSQTITINVSQYGYQTMGTSVGLRSYSTSGTVNTGANTDYTLILENIEEATLNLTPGVAAGTEATVSMQWGFNQTIAEPTSGINSSYYFRNGFESTLGLVFSSGTDTMGSTLRTPYGRDSASSSSSPSVTITENTMNPIFNTYGARYCFEKNRDLHGDGQITNPNTKNVNEINWYLPSADDLNNMYIGMSALSRGLAGTYYLSSSETWGSTVFTNSVNFNYGLGYTYYKSSATQVRCVRRIYQTFAAGVQNSPYVESGTRNVNNNGFSSKVLHTSNVARPTPSTANSTISPRFQVGKSDCQLYGATGGTTMTWSQAAGWNTASDNGSTPILASPVTGCNAYTEVAGDIGTWRLPTQREMYMLIIMRKELVATGYTPMSGIYYWTSDAWSSTYGWLGSTTTYALVFAPKNYLYDARCIKDL